MEIFWKEGRKSSSKVSIQYRTLSLHLATARVTWLQRAHTPPSLPPFKRSRTWNVRLFESEPRVERNSISSNFSFPFLSFFPLPPVSLPFLPSFQLRIRDKGTNLGEVRGWEKSWYFYFSKSLARWMIDICSFACQSFLFCFFSPEGWSSFNWLSGERVGSGNDISIDRLTKED